MVGTVAFYRRNETTLAMVCEHHDFILALKIRFIDCVFPAN